MSRTTSGNSLEEACSEIRERVSSGKLLPGERLLARKFTEEMGISRTLFREALRQLEGQGLLETTPHQGVRVRKLSPEQVMEIYRMREALEPIAVRSLVQQGVDQELFETLREACDARRNGATLGAKVRGDCRFHEVILRASPASEIWDVLKSRILVLFAFLIANGASAAGRRETAEHEEHERVLEAIEEGNAEEAAARMEIHLRNSREWWGRVVWDQGET